MQKTTKIPHANTLETHEKPGTLRLMLLKRAKDWGETQREFRWNIPAEFNIAEIACDHWARTSPDRPALLRYDGSTIHPVTYGELADQSRRLASFLTSRNVRRGDRIAILLPQCAETAIAHFAAYRMGAIAIPLASLFGPDALEFRLAFSRASTIITDAAGLEKLAGIRTSLPDLHTILSIDGGMGSAMDFRREVEKASADFERVKTLADDPALMIFTSGTTGPPKGALHGHRVVAGHMPGAMALHEFTPQTGDRFWTPADWAWAGGLLNILMPGLTLGVPVVFSKGGKFNPELAFDLMAKTKVANTFIPPTALKMMKSVSHPRSRFDLNLRTIFSGGEALGRETFEWGKETLGLTINEGYGQTECNLVLVSCGALNINRAGSMGKPAPGHTVAIIREDGSLCETDEPGQIAVLRPDPVMFLKYWEQPEATRQKFIGDWMTTGDQGLIDQDGYFFFVGRDDDIITSAGFRIGPGEIEDCLIAHPAVKLAAAIGKPDPIRTEIVKCYLVLEDGFDASDTLRADITHFVRSRLSAHEYPREIDFVSEMPLTTTGKVIRRHFRQQAVDEALAEAPQS